MATPNPSWRINEIQININVAIKNVANTTTKDNNKNFKILPILISLRV